MNDIPKQSYSKQAAETFYSPKVSLPGEGIGHTESTVHVRESDGGAFTLDIIPQYSYDGADDTWFDAPVANRFAQIDENSGVDYAETLEFSFGIYQRFKFVVAGANIDIDFDFYSVAKKR